MSKKFVILWLSGLCLAAVVIFFPSLNAPFILDDVAKIQDNPDLRTPNPSPAIFFERYRPNDTHFRNDPSRPLTFIFYWSAWQLGQGQSWPFHVFNILFHIGTAFLIGLIFHNLTGQKIWSVFASFLFLTLPINAGTVAYAYGLSDILGGFFSLACLFIVLRFQPSLFSIFLASVAFILALASKQSAIVVPALALLFAFPKRKFHIALWSLAAAYLCIRSFVFGGIGDLEAEGGVYPVLDYFFAQGAVIWRYVLFVLWPQGFSVDHAVQPKDFPVWLGILGWLFTAALTITAVLKLKHRSLMALGFLLFVISLIPVSSVVPTTDLMVERRAYVAVAGIVVIISGLMSLASRHVSGRAMYAGLYLLVLAQAVLGYERSRIYASEEKIWSESLNLYPSSHRAAVNLSTVYLKKGDVRSAKPVLEKLVERAPHDVDAWANLGTVYFYPGGPFTDLAKADEYFLKALAIDDKHVKTLSNRGFLKMTQQKFAEAEQLFRQAVELSPRTPLYLYGVGLSLVFQKKPNDARTFFEEAVKWDPNYEPAKNYLKNLSPQNQ